MKRWIIYAGASLFGLLLLAAAFFGGMVFNKAVGMPSLPRIGAEPAFNIGDRVEEVSRVLNDKALNSSSEESMTAGAIRGMLESLDDAHAAYLDARHFEAFNDQTKGEFFGIGITIAAREGNVYVVSPIEGTPAERAGLRSDDIIVAIDGEARERWDVDEVVTRVRGEAGTEVELGIRREGETDLLTFTIVRARIEIPNVVTRMEGNNVGYVRLLTFNDRSAPSVAEAIAELKAEGATSFVLDVRDNSGGLLSSSVEVASLFIDSGRIVSVEDADRVFEEWMAEGEIATDRPIVLLVNEHSASASEVLAGALQDYERATIVGEQTFGKGSVQTVEQLSFGGGVKFTIAHYLTPRGRVIDGVGVEPDVVVEMEPLDQDDEEKDIQLKRAVELAREGAR